ncbi:hypothetical protein [Rhodococcus sp. KRD175]|uniref:hypothetical protein n=1 Tax=Rhodococcus sp. KRD175 TaxID=2729729 RepID=UPI0019D1D915|nr:hypothetical protein [Rhodococcus sp. KRD175]
MTRTVAPVGSLIDRAYAAIDGYAEATEAVKTAENWVAGLSLPPSRDVLERELHIETVAAARRGDPMPDVIARLQQYANSSAYVVDQRRIAAAVVADLRAEVEQVTKAGINSAYAVLRDELDDILADVRGSADALRNVHSADDAIRAGVTEQWQSVDSLISRYEELRSAHWKLVQTEGVELQRSIFYACGLLADHLEHEPVWVARRSSSAAHTTQAPFAQAHREWLRSARTIGALSPDGRAALWPAEVEPSTWLLHIATHAQPWVPNAQTILDVHRAATEATIAVDDGMWLRSATAARAHHAELVDSVRAH